MPQFISSVVKDLLDKKESFINTTIVLPGKRPMMFFKQEFKIQSKNILLPKMISIEEFMVDLTDLQIISGVNLWFKAYNSYKKVIDKPDSFEDFLKWGPTILKDFDDIDASLVDPKNILNYLVSIERIEKWGKDEIYVNKNKLMQNHLLFWSTMSKFYFQFTEDLLKENLGYPGLISRIAATKIDNFLKEGIFNNYVFAGFNALTNAEQHIIFSLSKIDKAKIYWDADKYYLENKNQEAGFFLRKYKSILKDWMWTFDEFSKSKNIEITAVANQVSQAKHVGNILEKLSEEEIKDTALILADEAILPAILNSIPNNISYLNISMGIPLKTVPLAQFFKSIFELQLNREKLGKGKVYYYKNIIQILDNRSLIKFSTNSSKNLVNAIKINNRIFNSPNSLIESLEDSIFKNLFEIPQTLHGFVNCIKNWIIDLLAIINKESTNHENNLLKEYLFYFKEVFNQLYDNLIEITDVKDYKTLYLLYTKIVQSETISFIGEPLQGLQLMGLLETRLLNFKNIIITSVNDEILPLGRQNNTFIPYDIRKEMGMNTFTENDSIYAYHFYRLLQRGKNIQLIYTTETDGVSSGEKSRFISQIQFESNHEIKEVFASPNFKHSPLKKIEISKNKTILDKLEEWATDNGISASSLSTYLRNPLDFYEQRIFGVKEVDEAEENVSARTLGNIVHKTLEELYKPFLNKVLISNDFKSINTKKDQTLKKFFKEEYKDGYTTQGPNFLVYKIAERIINGVLEKDEILTTKHQLIILAIEEKFYIDFLLTNGKNVKFNGTIDRIDSLDGVTRIIDYKTGSVNKTLEVKTDKLDEIFSKIEKSKQLQLIFYAHLFYSKVENRAKAIQLCVYPIKFPKKELIKLKYNGDVNITQEIVTDTKTSLSLLIEEILNSENLFTESDN